MILVPSEVRLGFLSFLGGLSRRYPRRPPSTRLILSIPTEASQESDDNHCVSAASGLRRRVPCTSHSEATAVNDKDDDDGLRPITTNNNNNPPIRSLGFQPQSNRAAVRRWGKREGLVMLVGRMKTNPFI